MVADLSNLVRLNKTQVKPAAEVLSRAFQNYPLLQYYFHDELKRKKIALYFVSFAIFSGIRYGEIYAASPNLEGVAIWFPSDNYPVTIWKLVRSVPLSVIFGFGRYGGGRMRQLGGYVDAVHQRLAPFGHWFLQVIGVDPQFQGKGYAGKLLKPMLARIDEEGLPCYLETFDENNVSFYEHFGFAVIEKSNIPETNFTNWAMLRR
ncbi:hypothetical protein ES703_73510 [subsurface metagenome]